MDSSYCRATAPVRTDSRIPDDPEPQRPVGSHRDTDSRAVCNLHRLAVRLQKEFLPQWRPIVLPLQAQDATQIAGTAGQSGSWQFGCSRPFRCPARPRQFLTRNHFAGTQQQGGRLTGR